MICAKQPGIVGVACLIPISMSFLYSWNIMEGIAENCPTGLYT